ncbi:hypothetical protein PESHB5_19820 [Pediococcus parvulus]
MEIQNKIRELRKNEGLTLNEFSSRVNIPRANLSRYERGDREPKLATWEKLADFFQVSVPYIQGLGLQEQDKKNIIINVTFKYFWTQETINPSFDSAELDFYNAIEFFFNQKKIDWTSLYDELTDDNGNKEKAFIEFKKLITPYIGNIFIEVVSLSYTIHKTAFYDDYETDEDTEEVIIKGAIDTFDDLYNEQAFKPDYVKLSGIALDIERKLDQLKLAKLNTESTLNKESITSQIKEDIKQAYSLLHSIENNLH